MFITNAKSNWTSDLRLLPQLYLQTKRLWSSACSDLIALSYLSWVWGSSHVGGRQLSLPRAEFHQSFALGQKQSSRG